MLAGFCKNGLYDRILDFFNCMELFMNLELFS